MVDADRLCWAAEACAYAVALRSLDPLHCSPKNNLLVGWPRVHLGGGGSGGGAGIAPADCVALAISAVEDAVAEAAERSAAAAAASAAVATATAGAPLMAAVEGRDGTGARGKKDRGKNGGQRLGRPVMLAMAGAAGD